MTPLSIHWGHPDFWPESCTFYQLIESRVIYAEGVSRPDELKLNLWVISLASCYRAAQRWVQNK